MLKKTSIYLDEDLDHRLARRAADEGVTKAELIRRTLSSAVHRPTRPKPSLIGFAGDAPEDLSSDPDRYLDGLGA